MDRVSVTAQPLARLLAFSALVMCCVALLAPAKARAFDIDKSLGACEQYELPGQLDQRLACVNNSIDGLKGYLESLKTTYGAQTTACGVACVDVFKTDMNNCINKAKAGASQDNVDACINGVLSKVEGCTDGCGYPED